jgi:hypothetical protein
MFESRNEAIADEAWRPYFNWFQRHRLLSRAKRWLQSNVKPRDFAGSSWHYAYLNMPMLAMEVTADEARRIFSDLPVKVKPEESVACERFAGGDERRVSIYE